MPDPAFLPGTELAGAFYREVVRPLLGAQPHAAALLGWGSDVLGHDTATSTDHGWGPRLLVLVDQPATADDIRRTLDDALPERFRGWPVRYGWDVEPVRHHVTVTTPAAWSRDHFGTDVSRGLSDLDWLLTPQQRLLEATAGGVFADDLGALGRMRRALAWYPDHLWRWLLAAQWHRLAQEEAFVARTAEVGDETGSAITAARQVRDAVRLALLLDRRYAPYAKWLGTAFANSAHGDALPQHLRAVLAAPDAPARQAALAAALTALAERHNAAGLTAPLDPAPRDYHGRPARVLMADRFASALLDTVSDPALRRLPVIGAVDQVVDSADVLTAPDLHRRLRVLYPGVADTPPAAAT